jgi:UDP-GlcNAc:undecaprenyl-phosphate GlcNAc-1-phosphate transferase
MSVYLALIVAGSVLGLMLTPLVTKTSVALGLVDAPGGRKVHSRSVPRLGGVAVALAAMLAFVGVDWMARSQGVSLPSVGPMAPILAGVALVFAIGLIDDIRPL